MPSALLAQLYPDGFTDGSTAPNANYFLNAVYRDVPLLHPGVLGRTDNEGADAIKLAVSGALGLRVDYYVLVNLAGFQQLVDAMGGITVNINEPVPIGGNTDAHIPPDDYLQPGPDQRLNGFQALWFTRGRYGSTDYHRMARQRCAINAIVEEASPITMLKRYTRLATASKEIVRTDIPRKLLHAFVDLANEVKGKPIKSVSFELSPQFAKDGLLYFAFSEPGDGGTAGTAVARARLGDTSLQDVQVIWRQMPKVEGPNHFGSRIAFDGKGHVFISQGERNERAMAQDLDVLQGKLVRLNMDGSMPADNPFAAGPGVRRVIWSYGHRNMQGMAVDPRTGTLWQSEHGPRGGDELNLPQPGKNYGWPIITHGINYSGLKIPEAEGKARDDMYLSGIDGDEQALAAVEKGGPYKASFAFAYPLMGYAWGQFAADWLEGKSIPQVMQLDAIAYPGNSGGPVFDIDSGTVVGVLQGGIVKSTKEAALSAPTGITYAVPASAAAALLAEYVKR